MKKFNFWDIVCGWVVFAIAAATYLLTLEPTASFWDCGEFISSAHKLDVGHPPGAPFFMLMGHFFSLFAKDASQVAICVNALSGLASALTILFLFWTITALIRKIVQPDTLAKGIAILGAGAVGALAYTFSDTFWFSAVEGEVYASSSLFTAVVFWLILKWDECADDAGSDKWLIVIMYLMGLSIGVHLLNLLTIPAIVMVYYFRRYPLSVKGICAAFLASVVILAAILYGMIPGIPTIAGWFELLFVNQFHMPFNTGLAIYLVLLFVALGWAAYECYADKSKMRMIVSSVLAASLAGVPFLKESAWIGIILIAALFGLLYWKKDVVSTRLLNTAVMMIMVIVIGYSSYAVLVIRSTAQTPMDQNSPDNVFSLKYYLNREQYGDRPLFYGPTYASHVMRNRSGEAMAEDGAAQYAPAPAEDGKPDSYAVTGHKKTYLYKENVLFPRMYSSSHKQAYLNWMASHDSKMSEKHIPTFAENMKFFFSYQVDFMYWRYFMWNFAGRQDDIQNTDANVMNGNWICGIPFIDNARLGDQSKRPAELQNNKGHNVYYMLPLLLGLLGMAWQLWRKREEKQSEGLQSFFITFLLFFLTGLAIVIYLNQTPTQPRERDYAYAGSFYAFCIWIGMGVMMLFDLVSKLLKNKPQWLNAVSASVITLVCLGVPAQMASQNWDDHDRSKRYVCRDFGANYLMSCEPGGIIFSNGDNDTFPLWYNQEVEEVGTDLRVCNLSYLNTDWYIDQMKRPYYTSEALPISWTYKDYMQGKNEVMYFFYKESPTEMYGNALVDNRITFDDVKKEAMESSKDHLEIPGYSLSLTFPKDENGNGYPDMVLREWDGRKQYDVYTKSDLMVMEMIQTNNFRRPMYYAATVGNYMGLDPYLELTGLAYRITPTASRDGRSRVNTEVMYENMMHKFRYGNVAADGIYIDENTMRMCTTHRYMFMRLAEALYYEGESLSREASRTWSDEVKADSLKAEAQVRYHKMLDVLDYAEQVLPNKNVPYDHASTYMARMYYLGSMRIEASDEEKQAYNQKADAMLSVMAKNAEEYMAWGESLQRPLLKGGRVSNAIYEQFLALHDIAGMADDFDRSDLASLYSSIEEKHAQFINDFVELLQSRR